METLFVEEPFLASETHRADDFLLLSHFVFELVDSGPQHVRRRHREALGDGPSPL